jgi:hypothetical protein
MENVAGVKKKSKRKALNGKPSILVQRRLQPMIFVASFMTVKAIAVRQDGNRPYTAAHTGSRRL